jgi:hypothetical protein
MVFFTFCGAAATGEFIDQSLFRDSSFRADVNPNRRFASRVGAFYADGEEGIFFPYGMDITVFPAGILHRVSVPLPAVPANQKHFPVLRGQVGLIRKYF